MRAGGGGPEPGARDPRAQRAVMTVLRPETAPGRDAPTAVLYLYLGCFVFQT